MHGGGSRTVVWLLVAAGFIASACERRQEQASQKPSWFYDTQIAAKAAKKAFENNTEVSVSIHNPTSKPVVIQGLGDVGSVVLVHDGGREAKPHKISVGVHKPIVVPARGTKTTSLLFEAASGVPRQLRIYGREHAIP
jgi:hypothetical protein